MTVGEMGGVVEAVYLDDWDADVREKPIPADPETVEATIRQIAGRSCADLFFYPDAADVGWSGGRWLAVTASGGQFAVTAQLGEGEWAHLVGDACAEGEAEFAHGGQPATWPRRFLVSIEDAIAAARHYVVDADLLDPSRWSWAE